MRKFSYLGLLAYFYCALAAAGISFHRLEAPPGSLATPGTLAPSTSSAYQQKLNFPAVAFDVVAKGEMRAALPGAKSLLVDRMPEVPMILKQFPVPSGSLAHARLENLILEESDSSVRLKQLPDSFVWSVSHDLSFAEDVEGRYFPGKFMEAKESAGVLNVVIFPVQVDRQTGKVIQLRQANLTVALAGNSLADAPGVTHWGSEGIILTTDKLRTAAELLKTFHGNSLGLRSEIVTVETISRTETPIAEAELPEGYKSKNEADSVIHEYNATSNAGYNYELARKIIHHLRKKFDSGLKYVTILGDARAVPPSYYFSIASGFGRKFGVTDLCYGALNQCTDAKVAVGRLPFSSKEELGNYLSKATRWLDYAPQASSELSLFGGKAFPVDVFIGELGTLKTLNSDKVSWRGVKKHYRTKKNFNKRSVLDLVHGNQPSAFVYYLDHGNGNQWYVEREYVSSKEILNAPSAGSATNPLVVSIACTNAAFDHELVKEDLLKGTQDGEVAVGVAMLRSKAGAVAYLGSGRPALGAPVYNVDNSGNLNLTGTTYGLQMFDTFYEKYHKSGGGRLGDAVLAMYRAFLTENGNDMENDRNVWTYFNVVLLGDPALPLPNRSQKEQAYGFAKSSVQFAPAQFGGFPRFLQKDETLLEIAFSALTEIRATLLKMAGGEEVVSEKTLQGGGTLPMTMDADSQGQYFLRLENAEGVPLERQVWFNVSGDE